MGFKPQRLCALALITISVTGLLFAAKKKTEVSNAKQMDDRKKVLHALNRLTFGPRPGDVEQVQAMGLDKWIDQQLHPDKINDDALQARLAGFSTLRMSTQEMVRNFPPPQVIRAVAEGRISMPTDPEERAIYQAQLDRYNARKQNKQEAAENAQADANMTANAEGQMVPSGTPSQPTDNTQQKQKQNEDQAALEARFYADIAGAQTTDKVLQLPPDQRVQAILNMSSDERQDFMKSLKGEEKNQLLEGLEPRQRETLMALAAPQAVIQSELQQAKLLRAVYGSRQLEEVMTDFWFNHFNIYIDKGADKYLITAYERDVIRPHALGKFKDLLMATAKSPAMLFYLDNWQSVGPHSQFAQGGQRRMRPFENGGFGRPRRNPQDNPAKRQARGLNENYAREVMELHTLGVDGGYTQADVTELARVLTGWTLDKPGQGVGVNGFTFNERTHEPGKKTILGKTFDNDGENEGNKALEMLAHHPATAHFISKKLAIRFVGDNPPDALVDRMAQKFLSSDGDIREVLKTMISSPEFWTDDAYRAKVKTPLEFVASALRATNAEIEKPQPLVETLKKMGMPLYGMQPPTGYSNKAEAWVNSAALLNRLNFGLALGTGHMRGITIDLNNLNSSKQEPADSESALALMESALLSGDVSGQTHAALLKQLNDPNNPGLRPVAQDQNNQNQSNDQQQSPRMGMIAGLVLGSPEFQRR